MLHLLATEKPTKIDLQSSVVQKKVAVPSREQESKHRKKSTRTAGELQK